MPTRPDPPETGGVAKIADMLRLSRQCVSQLTKDGARENTGLREPWISLRMGKVWLDADM